MMLLAYPFTLSALALCLILTGVLSFFGYHVVRRGVIFVDLALAQVAALGASIGIMMGWGEQHPTGNFMLSLAFTLFGAILFSWFRNRSKLPIEALIGVTYAGAMAFSLIVLEKSATGSEELKEMLVGSILTVSPSALAIAGALAVGVGFLLWLARKPLFMVTEDARAAKAKGLKLWFWDIFFYTAFGVIVTYSVRVAGVLLVFAFLIVPSLASILALSGTWRRIAFGWVFGAVGCVLGLEASLRLDWSAGPCIVTTFIILLILVGVASMVRSRKGLEE